MSEESYCRLSILFGTNLIGDNIGYNLQVTQVGLCTPHDAKIIGDYIKISKPYIK
jgi:hypothetical protein